METDLVVARSRVSFADILAIGFGSGFFATFAVLWVSVFFSSQLSLGIGYEE